ncbi:IS110 family transposase [Desulfoscipio geothermicus]|uniref:Transposase n=1 Tax=Desulfoscipio geothermicus DSM 3669 TaxID=1121426 RepID=A0A1I6EKV1_9FIRM|nr:transposase [Desulfoscipio geothermicus]SFR18399.1 Transposase [Desulfoscipio geothermicus DSM 3669]
MHKPQAYVYVGIDTHKDEHIAVMINCWNQKLQSFILANNPVKFTAFLEEVFKHVPAGLIPAFGLEDTGGLGRSLAQFLYLQGHVVKEVNPVIVNREAIRKTHPQKTDHDDALDIAKALLDNFLSLPDVIENDIYVAVRELSKHRDALIKEQTRLKNRLHHVLHKQYPCYETMFKNPFRKATLAFWLKFPTPLHLKNYGVKTC